MDSETWPGIAVLAAALAMLAIVVAAEAGVIARLRTRVAERRDVSRLQALERYVRERQETLSALALARSLTVVGISAIVAFVVIDVAGHNWAALAIGALATVIGLTLAQTLPRLLVSQEPERWDRALHPFVTVVRRSFTLPAKILDLPVSLSLNWWRSRHEQAADDAAELLRLAELEETTGALPLAEREMIRSILEMGETMAREIMVPRIDIAAIEADTDFDTLVQRVAETGHSRLPVFEDSMDKIIGVLHAKQVLRQLAKGNGGNSARQLAHPAYFIPESKRLAELLSEMRLQKVWMAIVVDEYGGTAGLVTLEDVVEEIVGEITDEFEVEEQPVLRISPSEAIVDGKVDVDVINDLLDVAIEKKDFDTVGGFVVDELGKMPAAGDEVSVNGLQLRVLSVAGRRIKKVRIRKEKKSPNGAREEPSNRQ